MGVRLASAETTTLQQLTITTTTETVILTTPPLSPTPDGAMVRLFWWFLMLSGTGTNALFVNVRRGTLVTSPLINLSNSIIVSAAVNLAISGCYIDQPGVVGGQQYSISIQQNAATGNGTMKDACFIAMVL